MISMLDIKIFRDNPELIKDNQKRRGLDVKDVEEVVKLDKEWRSLKEEADALRAKRNKISQEINMLKKSGKNADMLLKVAKEIPSLLEQKELLMNEKKDKRDSILREIPNIVDKSVPT